MGNNRRTLTDTDWDGYLWDRAQFLGMQNWNQDQLRGRDLNNQEPGVAFGCGVTESAVPAMTVDVAAGGTIQENGALGVIPVTLGLALATADGSLPRIDLIVAQVTEATGVPLVNASTSAVFDSEIIESGAVSVVTGIPNAVPSAPAKTTGSVVLASVLVGAAVTEILDIDITVEDVYRGGPRESASQRADMPASRILMPAAIGDTYLDAWSQSLNFSFRGHQSGQLMSKGTVPDDDVTLSAGTVRNTGDNLWMNLASALTKGLDAVWAEGDAVGGRASAIVSVANDTWYRFFSIAKADGTTDAGFDSIANDDAEDLLIDAAADGYAFYRQRGYVRTDGSGNIFKFLINPNDPDFVLWDQPVNSAAFTSWGTTASLYTALAPPGTIARLNHGFYWIADAGGFAELRVLLTPVSVADLVVTNATYNIRMARGGANDSHVDNNHVEVEVDASSQYRWRAQVASSETPSVELMSLGYRYRRAADE